MQIVQHPIDPRQRFVQIRLGLGEKNLGWRARSREVVPLSGGVAGRPLGERLTDEQHGVDERRVGVFGLIRVSQTSGDAVG